MMTNQEQTLKSGAAAIGPLDSIIESHLSLDAEVEQTQAPTAARAANRENDQLDQLPPPPPLGPLNENRREQQLTNELSNNLSSSTSTSSASSSNFCAACQTPIKDRFIFNVINQGNFHQQCVRCADCLTSLNERCFTFAGKLYCRLDYWRRFGPKCSACSEAIKPTELVQRLKNDLIYHLTCFVCLDCKRHLQAGEQLHLMEDKRLLCKRDYFNQQQQQQQHKNSNNNGANKNQNNSDHNHQNHVIRNHHHHNHNHQQQRQASSTPVTSPAPSNANLSPSDHHHQLTLLNGSNLDNNKQHSKTINGNNATNIGINRLSNQENQHQISTPSDDSNDQQLGPQLKSSISISSSSSTSSTVSNHSTSSTINSQRSTMASASLLASRGSAPNANSLVHHNHHHHQNQHLQSQDHHNNSGSNNNTQSTGGGGGGGGGGHKPTRVRTVLNEKQLQTLRDCYAHNPRPDALLKEQLVDMTGLSPRVIRVWFQNKRCKDKKKSILYKQMQQHEKDGRHLAGLTHIRGIPMVASSPIQYQDDQSSGAVMASAVESPQQSSVQSPTSQLAGTIQQQQQQQKTSVLGQAPTRTQQHSPAMEIHAYQPSWKNLVDYAERLPRPPHHQTDSPDIKQQAGAAIAVDQIDRLNTSSPRYQQLITQVGAPIARGHQIMLITTRPFTD